MAEVIITDQNFASEVAQNKLPYWLILGTLVWPRAIISPIVEELAKEFEGKKK